MFYSCYLTKQQHNTQWLEWCFMSTIQQRFHWMVKKYYQTIKKSVIILSQFSTRCLPNAACDTNVRRCNASEAIGEGISTINITSSGKPVQCGSVACRLTSACQQYTNISTSDSVAKVCILNGTSSSKSVRLFSIDFIFFFSRLSAFASIQLH